MDALEQEVSQLSLGRKPASACEKETSKKNLTAYWGIELDPEVFEHPPIKTHLEGHQELIPLKKIHSTLLYVGKKDDNPHEAKFQPLEGKECTLQVTHFGTSEEAMALQIHAITYQDEHDCETPVPTHATQQHVTMALKKGVKPVDSVKCFQHQLHSFEQPLTIKGTIKRYLY